MSIFSSDSLIERLSLAEAKVKALGESLIKAKLRIVELEHALSELNLKEMEDGEDNNYDFLDCQDQGYKGCVPEY